MIATRTHTATENTVQVHFCTAPPRVTIETFDPTTGRTSLDTTNHETLDDAVASYEAAVEAND